MTLFRSLTYPSFALLWSGQTLSRIGDYLYQVALAWWVLEKTGSAITMSTVLIFSFTPMLLFLLIGGAAVDRLPRVRLMLVSDLLRGLIVTVVAILAFSQRLEIWHILIASLIFGLVDAVFQPAYTALVPELIPTDVWPSANSLSSMSYQIGRIGGPALGAIMIGLGGTPAAFLFNALSFFISAACLTPLLQTARRAPDQFGRSALDLFRDVREGFIVVLQPPILWVSILIFALSNITLSGPYNVALPFLVKDHLGADMRMLGLLYALFPIGYLLGGIWLGRKARLRQRGLTMCLGGVVAGLGLLALGLSVPLPVIGLAALANGAALEVAGLIWTNILQEQVPGEKLGRVASIDMLGSYCLLPVGYALAGWATELFGPAQVFVIGGAITMILTGLGLAHPALRRLD